MSLIFMEMHYKNGSFEPFLFFYFLRVIFKKIPLNNPKNFLCPKTPFLENISNNIVGRAALLPPKGYDLIVGRAALLPPKGYDLIVGRGFYSRRHVAIIGAKHVNYGAFQIKN